MRHRPNMSNQGPRCVCLLFNKKNSSKPSQPTSVCQPSSRIAKEENSKLASKKHSGMDGLFKKTMDFLSTETVVAQDEFVGKIVEVAAIKLKIVRKIAEGELKFGIPPERRKLLCCYRCSGEKAHDSVTSAVIKSCGRMWNLNNLARPTSVWPSTPNLRFLCFRWSREEKHERSSAD